MDTNNKNGKSSKNKKGDESKGEGDTKLAKSSTSVEVISPEGNHVVAKVDVGAQEDEEVEVTKENRSSLLKVLTNAVGIDVTTITLPVTICEPASFLMRLCEQLQYSELLDKAASCEDPLQRLAYVAVFAISCYTVGERTAKPFNPILGETYEYVNEDRGNMKFIAEQVSHHPPVGSSHCETDTWKFWMSQCLKTKFTGNGLDCYVVGSNNVYLKTTDEWYKWEGVKTAVHNVIIGKAWIDHHGEKVIYNKKTGEKAKLNFTQCGWFSKGWREVNGEVYDAKGNACISLVGKRNEAIYAKALSKYAEKLKSQTDSGDDSINGSSPAPTNKSQKKERKKAEEELKKEQKLLKKQLKKKLLSEDPLWQHTIKPLPAEKIGCKYALDWTEHTLEVAALTEDMKKYLPPTDSRLRPDRMALQKGDSKSAGQHKHALEEKQREDRRKREKLGQHWSPKWFKLSKDGDGQEYYEYLGGYWEERQKRMDAAKVSP